jgi:tryptophanyl-tRNA synthetase
MQENHIYNLMLQITEEHKSVWRMENEYKQDARNCNECKNLWQKIATNKQDHIEQLTKQLKVHIQ